MASATAMIRAWGLTVIAGAALAFVHGCGSVREDATLAGFQNLHDDLTVIIVPRHGVDE